MQQPRAGLRWGESRHPAVAACLHCVVPGRVLVLPILCLLPAPALHV